MRESQAKKEYLLLQVSAGAIDDESESGSTHSGSNEEPSIYGLYKGIGEEGGGSSLGAMAMWSPDFSFGSKSATSPH